MLTEDEKLRLKTDIQTWSGGGGPGELTGHEIETYLNYALPTAFVGREREVRDFMVGPKMLAVGYAQILDSLIDERDDDLAQLLRPIADFLRDL